jgi:hypothetical protein
MMCARTISAVVAAFLATGCNLPSTPEAHANAMTLTSTSLARRQAQTRRYDTASATDVMSASVAVLQDLGFTVEETSLGAGLINASKARPGTVIRASIVVRAIPGSQAMTARVSFQALGLGGKLQVVRAETVDDAQLFREFFDKLSQSLFLQGQEI